MTTLETLKAANLVLSECYADYSHPNFTDRHNTASRIKTALVAVRESINSNGAELIQAERVRQQQVEGWTPEHDDEHDAGEMLGAATSYLQEGWAQIFEDAAPPSVNGHGEWPWDMKWWKPSPYPIRNLVKAGALIAAEIDRLQRLEVTRD